MIAGRFRWPTGGATDAGEGRARRFRLRRRIAAPDRSRLQAPRVALCGAAAERSWPRTTPAASMCLTSTAEDFARQLRLENHTLKRALTDPQLFSGIGNAYSDEILHAAKLSPMQLTSRLGDDEIERLLAETRGVLTHWRDALIAEAGDTFPEKVTAFREGMAAHGRFGKPCPVCGTPIQRIKYASNEANYCPDLPDRRKPAGRSRALAAAERRLAAFARGARALEGGAVVNRGPVGIASLRLPALAIPARRRPRALRRARSPARSPDNPPSIRGLVRRCARAAHRAA